MYMYLCIDIILGAFFSLHLTSGNAITSPSCWRDHTTINMGHDSCTLVIEEMVYFENFKIPYPFVFFILHHPMNLVTEEYIFLNEFI